MSHVGEYRVREEKHLTIGCDDEHTYIPRGTPMLVTQVSYRENLEVKLTLLY